MFQEFNVYDNIRTPQVKNFTTIDQWFNLIQNSKFSGIISQARSFGKGDPLYDNIKATLPAITYNFTFADKKSNENITGNTGLLYIDIDDSSFDINSLDKHKVFAHYKSFGGIGYSVLVKVAGLTFDNYEAAYTCICAELGLTNFYDKGARKATQFNVLSFDPNIFVNHDCNVFSVPSDIKNVCTSDVLRKKEEAYTVDVHTFSSEHNAIRFDSLGDHKFLGDYTVDWNGFHYVNCWIPMKKIEKNRNRALLSYGSNLVYLNPQLTLDGLISILSNVNPLMCLTPVDDAQIKRIAKSIIGYKLDGTLKPIINNKPRKILFAKDAMLNADEKMEIVRKELGKKKADDSKAKLYNIIEDWNFEKNGKITHRAIVKVGGVSNKTVIKYFPEFKDYVKSINHEYAGAAVKPEKVKKIIPAIINDEFIKAGEDVEMVEFCEGQFVAQLEGYEQYSQITNSLNDNDRIDFTISLLTNYAGKKVNEFSITVHDKVLDFFTNDTLENGFIQFKGYKKVA